MENRKLSLLGCLLAVCSVGSALGGTIQLKGEVNLTISPQESLWNGLSHAGRFPTILSGDLIALKLARSNGTHIWMGCGGYYSCDASTCPGATITKEKFSSCRKDVFRIYARGKINGETVNSGDHVRLKEFSRENVDWRNRFRCYMYTTRACNTYSYNKWNENMWFSRNFATFRIFSRNAQEGRPIQFGDIVGFKFPYQSNTAWLTYSSETWKFYARPCNGGNYDKLSCAKIDAPTGFQIFKKI